MNNLKDIPLTINTSPILNVSVYNDNLHLIVLNVFLTYMKQEYKYLPEVETMKTIYNDFHEIAKNHYRKSNKND